MAARAGLSAQAKLSGSGLAWAVAYGVISVVITLFNKAVLTSYGFSAAMTLTLLQGVVSVVGCELLKATGKPELQYPAFAHCRWWVSATHDDWVNPQAVLGLVNGFRHDHALVFGYVWHDSASARKSARAARARVPRERACVRAAAARTHSDVRPSACSPVPSAPPRPRRSGLEPWRDLRGPAGRLQPRGAAGRAREAEHRLLRCGRARAGLVRRPHRRLCA